MCYEVGAEISRYCERSTIHELCWRTTQIFPRCCSDANRRTHGSSCFQLGPVSLGHRADLRWRWNLLTSLAMDDHSCEVNCDLSDEMCSGMPKRAIQWQTSAWTQLEAVVLLRGIASGQWEKQSTTVNKWVYTLEGGREGSHKINMYVAESMWGILEGLEWSFGVRLDLSSLACNALLGPNSYLLL